MAASARKSYSLFQRGVRVAQTSVRGANAWVLDRMPGLPNPPEMDAEVRQPTFVDLWEFTLADHRRHLRDAWREYRATFEDADEIDIEKSKQQVREAAQRLRGEVASNTSKNAAFLEAQLEGTQVLKNVNEIQTTASENVSFLKDEMGRAQKHVDPEVLAANVRAVVAEHRSQKDVVSTVKDNVDELISLARTGREAALRLEKEDVDAIKSDAQSWFADKLMVAQSVLVAFIDGYREGKAQELEREDALLITMAQQAADQQKIVLKEQFDQFVSAQREKQKKEQQQQQEEEQEQGHERQGDATIEGADTQQQSRPHEASRAAVDVAGTQRSRE